jgi:hypothetical protein
MLIDLMNDAFYELTPLKVGIGMLLKLIIWLPHHVIIDECDKN